VIIISLMIRNTRNETSYKYDLSINAYSKIKHMFPGDSSDITKSTWESIMNEYNSHHPVKIEDQKLEDIEPLLYPRTAQAERFIEVLDSDLQKGRVYRLRYML
jgi:hypothetical protein